MRSPFLSWFYLYELDECTLHSLRSFHSSSKKIVNFPPLSKLNLRCVALRCVASDPGKQKPLLQRGLWKEKGHGEDLKQTGDRLVHYFYGYK